MHNRASSDGWPGCASSKRLFDLTDTDFTLRLSAVRRALYLLFNEGYHGASAESAIRVELCNEAIRLTALLCEHLPAAAPETNALAALMHLHAAREHFSAALALARNPMERRFLEKRGRATGTPGSGRRG